MALEISGLLSISQLFYSGSRCWGVEWVVHEEKARRTTNRDQSGKRSLGSQLDGPEDEGGGSGRDPPLAIAQKAGHGEALSYTITCGTLARNNYH